MVCIWYPSDCGDAVFLAFVDSLHVAISVPGAVQVIVCSSTTKSGLRMACPAHAGWLSWFRDGIVLL